MRQKGFAPIIILLVLAGMGLLAYFGYSYKTSVQPSPQSTPTETGSPRNDSEKYEIKSVDNEWELLSPKDLNISFQIPKTSKISLGEGTDEDFSTNSSQLAVTPPIEIANMVFGVDWGEIGNIDSTKLINTKVTRLKQVGSARDCTGGEVLNKSIGGVQGHELIFKCNSGSTNYHLLLIKNDHWLDIWYNYPWTGIDLTGKESVVADKILSTFNFTGK